MPMVHLCPPLRSENKVPGTVHRRGAGITSNLFVEVGVQADAVRRAVFALNALGSDESAFGALPTMFASEASLHQ